MQGKGVEVVQKNAASANALGVDIGLAISPVLGVMQGAARITSSTTPDCFQLREVKTKQSAD